MKVLALLLLGIAAAVVVRSGGPDGPSGSVSGDLVQTISKGEEVDLEDYLEDGVWTLIEFTADW